YAELILVCPQLFVGFFQKALNRASSRCRRLDASPMEFGAYPVPAILQALLSEPRVSAALTHSPMK
ncbi:Hypothetical predicted protein, partial [Pelobates cultripes]